MRALLPKIAISFLAIALVATVGGLWMLGRSSLSSTSGVTSSLSEPISLPVIRSCFPGRSTEVTKLRLRDFSCFSESAPPFFHEWFAKHLRAMKEPSLLAANGSDETYRFLWLRTFHHPIAVRVWHTGDRYFSATKELSGAGGYEPGRVIVDKSRSLTPEEWLTFTRLLEASCFWNLPTEEMNGRGNDGAEWIMEGLKEGRYQVTDVWTPASGSYRDACIYLLKTSGLGIDEKSKDLY